MWDAGSFERLRADVRSSCASQIRDLLAVTARVLAADRVLERRIESMASVPGLIGSLEDVAGQRSGLVFDGFVGQTGRDRMGDVERYLSAMAVRLDKLGSSPERDRERMATIARVQEAYAHALDRFAPGSPVDRELERIGWQIEELRVNLFAQAVGTPGPVSEERLLRSLDALTTRPEVAPR